MKKTVKKTLLALLSFIIVLTLASCGKEDPAKVWEEAMAKNAALTDMDAAMEMNMEMEAEGEKMSIAMNLEMKMNRINTDEMCYAADTEMNMKVEDMDFDIDGSTYYVDGYCYTEMMGQKMKYAMDLDTMMKSIEQNNLASGLDTGSMKNLSMKKDGDNRILIYTADPEAMSDGIEGIMDIMNGQLAMLGGMDIQMNVKEIKGECTINQEGYMTKSVMAMSFEMEIEGMLCTVTADTITEVKNPGQPVEVTIPDLSGFKEISY